MRVSVRLLSTAVLLAAVVTVASVARADLDGDEFESIEWRVRLTAPRNWQLSERSSYPNVLLWMSRRNPRGRMLFSAERLPASETALGYARRTVTKLASLGFRSRAPQLHAATGAYWIDVENRTSFLRQAFLVAGEIGYTLTLAADSSRDRSQHLRSFDAALRSITVLRPPAPDPDATIGSTSGPSAGQPPVPIPAASAEQAP